MGNNVNTAYLSGKELPSIDIRIPYGTGQLLVSLPDETPIDVIQYRDAAATDPDAVLREALAAPIGSPTLAELARAAKNAVVLISDITRLCPSPAFLPHLLDELNRGGVPDERIRIVVALGMHRKQTPAELEKLAGSRAMARVQVMNHSALDEDCVRLGTSALGTPIEINRTVAEADLIVATGNIEPHALAGMSGGVKALVPGVASRSCIETNHALSQQYRVQPGHPDNPIRRDLEDALQFVPLKFLLNVVVNHRREIMAAVAGDPVAAHRAGVRLARRYFLVPTDRAYDVVLASTGGYPKDMQLYQAVKTLVNASAIAAERGSILLAARCEEMFGNGIFQLWVETIQDRARMVQMLKRKFVLGAHKIEHIDRVLSEQTVYLYSDLPDSTVELLGFRPVADVQETVRRLLHTAAKPRSAAYMPYGAITFPVIHQPN